MVTVVLCAKFGGCETAMLEQLLRETEMLEQLLRETTALTL